MTVFSRETLISSSLSAGSGLVLIRVGRQAVALQKD